MSAIISLAREDAQPSSYALLRRLRAEALYKELKRERSICLDGDSYRQFADEGLNAEAFDLAASDLVDDKRAEFKLSGLTIKLVLTHVAECERAA